MQIEAPQQQTPPERSTPYLVLQTKRYQKTLIQFASLQPCPVQAGPAHVRQPKPSVLRSTCSPMQSEPHKQDSPRSEIRRISFFKPNAGQVRPSSLLTPTDEADDLEVAFAANDNASISQTSSSSKPNSTSSALPRSVPISTSPPRR